MTDIEIITTDSAPLPAGHYSQAVVSGGFVFVSGQLPVLPNGSTLAAAPIQCQMRQCLLNLHRILRARGGSLADVLRVTEYLSDIRMWPDVNDEFANQFCDHKPARTVVPAGPLHFGCDVEIDAIAILRVPTRTAHL